MCAASGGIAAVARAGPAAYDDSARRRPADREERVSGEVGLSACPANLSGAPVHPAGRSAGWNDGRVWEPCHGLDFRSGEDAPGAAMLSIVTARGVERWEEVRFEVSLGRRSGQCVGEQWTHSGGRSQACWVVVPKAIGTHQITAFADIRAPDGNHHHTATAARPVSGKGPVTDQVTEQERDRIHRCGNTTDRVWLTFDDGFVSKTTMNSMLATLARENVKRDSSPQDSGRNTTRRGSPRSAGRVT